MNNKPDINTKDVLKAFSELIEEIGKQFFYVTMGGIAVDGYAGKITRDHPDVDMLIFREDLVKAENILKELGYECKRFTHPVEQTLEYKMQTGDEDHLFSFQILDSVDNDNFIMSFYRDLHSIFPNNQIKPPTWLVLENVRFPAVSREFLIKLKKNEVLFFEKLKVSDPEKYLLKRKEKHLKCLHDINFLENDTSARQHT